METGFGLKSFTRCLSINLVKITLYKNDKTKPGDTNKKEKKPFDTGTYNARVLRFGEPNVTGKQKTHNVGGFFFHLFPCTPRKHGYRDAKFARRSHGNLLYDVYTRACACVFTHAGKATFSLLLRDFTGFSLHTMGGRMFTCHCAVESNEIRPSVYKIRQRAAISCRDDGQQTNGNCICSCKSIFPRDK